MPVSHRVLIAYATTHGHTGRIAELIAERLDAAGIDVDLEELRKHVAPAAAPPPARFDALVAAGSLHAGRHQRQLVDWLREHRDALAERPSTLISVSLTAADDTDEARAATRACVDELIDDSGWTPDRVLYVAGALQYREYDLPTRVLMRLIAHRHHQPTNVHEDVDYTDWAAIDRFASELAAELGGPPVAAAGADRPHRA